MRLIVHPILTLLLTLSITACCSASNSTQHTEAGVVTNLTNIEPTDLNTTDTPPVPESVASTAPTLLEETTAPANVESVKLYRMTDAYRFKPIEQSTPDKVVLLTFDDGPHDEVVLTSILDTLDKHSAKAIFFVNGYRVKQKPELLKLMDDRGQTIGNHSWDHINLKDERQAVVEQQINDVQTTVEKLIGKKPLFLRPPYGAGSDLVKEITKNHGMLYMTWSNGSLDWDQSAKDKPDVVISNVMEQLHPGANILMHELKWTADALDELLTRLEQQGYSFIDPAEIQITH